MLLSLTHLNAFSYFFIQVFFARCVRISETGDRKGRFCTAVEGQVLKMPISILKEWQSIREEILVSGQKCQPECTISFPISATKLSQRKKRIKVAFSTQTKPRALQNACSKSAQKVGSPRAYLPRSEQTSAISDAKSRFLRCVRGDLVRVRISRSLNIPIRTAHHCFLPSA